MARTSGCVQRHLMAGELIAATWMLNFIGERRLARSRNREA